MSEENNFLNIQPNDLTDLTADEINVLTKVLCALAANAGHVSQSLRMPLLLCATGVAANRVTDVITAIACSPSTQPVATPVSAAAATAQDISQPPSKPSEALPYTDKQVRSFFRALLLSVDGKQRQMTALAETFGASDAMMKQFRVIFPNVAQDSHRARALNKLKVNKIDSISKKSNVSKEEARALRVRVEHCGYLLGTFWVPLGTFWVPFRVFGFFARKSLSTFNEIIIIVLVDGMAHLVVKIPSS